jgi:hypothetical protein
MIKKTKNKITVLVMGCSMFAASLSSCTTSEFGDKRSDGTVVERNKQSRPAWVDSPTDRLLVNSTETRFHYSLRKQRDLPIAVKQTQIMAIDSSYNLWLSGFEQRLGDYPQIKGLKSSTRTNKETLSILEQIAKKTHSEVAQIEDIYYEKIRIDNYAASPELQGVTEYFDVHVLVQLLPVDSEKLKNSLANGFSNSKLPEIKKVGRELSPTKDAKAK